MQFLEMNYSRSGSMQINLYFGIPTKVFFILKYRKIGIGILLLIPIFSRKNISYVYMSYYYILMSF